MRPIIQRLRIWHFLAVFLVPGVILGALRVDGEHELKPMLGIIEEHLHGREFWFGEAADQSGDNWGSLTTLEPFRATSGAGVWGRDEGDSTKVLGPTDTPIMPGKIKFVPQRIIVSARSSNTSYRLRIICGNGTLEQAIAAGQTSEYLLRMEDKRVSFPQIFRTFRIDAGCKVWVQCMNSTNNATIDFFIGIHEYKK